MIDQPRPMLASAFVRECPTGDAFESQFGTAWALEEKLDGHRCIVRVDAGRVEAWSRPQPGRGGVGLTRALPPAMVEVLRTLPSGDYDGELVAAAGKAWEVRRTGAALVFVTFDLLRSGPADLTRSTYDARRAALLDALRLLPRDQSSVSTVMSLYPTWRDVQAIWARGGEGAILKHRASAYEPGRRSASWLKVKQVLAATLTSVGFEAGKSGPFSAWRLRDAAGIVTTVKTLDDAQRRAIATDPQRFVGVPVVISFQERTPSGTYRHGRFDHFAGPAEVIASVPRR